MILGVGFRSGGTAVIGTQSKQGLSGGLRILGVRGWIVVGSVIAFRGSGSTTVVLAATGRRWRSGRSGASAACTPIRPAPGGVWGVRLGVQGSRFAVWGLRSGLKELIRPAPAGSASVIHARCIFGDTYRVQGLWTTSP